MISNLVGIAPERMLLHGPTKLLVNDYHWHDPQHGIIASYTPTANDVKDHFGVFRGVDQIESFVQATACSCAAFLTRIKNNYLTDADKDAIPVFISIGGVHFHSYLEEGDTFITIGQIKFYKFRQMVVDGRIYKVPPFINLNEHFKNFTIKNLGNYNVGDNFTLVAELFDITGRTIKKQTAQ